MNNIITNDVVKNISSSFNKININDLSEPQLIKIGKMIIVDKLKDDLTKKVKVNNFDYKKIKDIWLQQYKSKNTKIAYNKALTIWEEYLDRKNLNVLEVKALEIDSFISELNKIDVISNATKRLYISALSAFYSQLERWDFINRNYFKGSRLPKRERSRELKVPSDTDIEQLMNTVKHYNKSIGRGSLKQRKSAEKNLIILELLIKTGIRIGAVKTLKVGQNGKLTGYSKGKNFEIYVDNDLAYKLKTINLSSITETCIQKFVYRACKRANITIYNCHSFRHYFAIKYYTEYKDIYKLCKLLNHSSIMTTENYLKSLRIL